MADPADAAWEGWQDAITHLGIEELYDRVRATWKDKRNPCEPGDQEYVEEQLADAHTPSAARQSWPRACVRRSMIPVQALSWTAREMNTKRNQSRKRTGLDPIRRPMWLSVSRNSIGSQGSSPARRFRITRCAWNRSTGFSALSLPGRQRAPAEYLPVIWDTGDAPDPDVAPEYDSVEQADYVDALLTRHWKAIATRLDRGYPHEPVLERSPRTGDGRYWAGGFIRGVAMRAEVWGSRTSDDFASAFLNMVIAIGIGRDKLAEENVDLDARNARRCAADQPVAPP